MNTNNNNANTPTIDDVEVRTMADYAVVQGIFRSMKQAQDDEDIRIRRMKEYARGCLLGFSLTPRTLLVERSPATMSTQTAMNALELRKLLLAIIEEFTLEADRLQKVALEAMK